MPACGGTLYSHFGTPQPCPTSPHIYFAQFHGNDVKVNDKSMHFALEGFQKSCKINAKLIQNRTKNGFKIDPKMVWFRVCLGGLKKHGFRVILGGPQKQEL